MRAPGATATGETAEVLDVGYEDIIDDDETPPMSPSPRSGSPTSLRRNLPGNTNTLRLPAGAHSPYGSPYDSPRDSPHVSPAGAPPPFAHPMTHPTAPL